jgi:hypothetical protein
MNTIDTSQPDNELSNEMHELISYRPYWIIRKGNAIFVLILFSLLALAWFIKYPDIVSGSVKSGRLFVSQNDAARIKKGQAVFIHLKSHPGGGRSGNLTGFVDSISHLPTARDSFLVLIDLPPGLEGNDLTLPVSVVTEDRRLIDRIFSKLINL